MQQHIFKDTIKANVGKKSYFESEQDVMITAPLGWKKKKQTKKKQPKTAKSIIEKAAGCGTVFFSV